MLFSSKHAVADSSKNERKTKFQGARLAFPPCGIGIEVVWVRRFELISDRILRDSLRRGERGESLINSFHPTTQSKGVFIMKRALATVVCLLVLMAATAPIAEAQGRSRFGRKSRTAAIIGGGALAGAVIAGKKGAAVGAGSGALYAMNRQAAQRNFSSRNRRIGTVLGGTALGAGLGAAVGGKRSAAVGALAGAGGSYLYTKKSRRYPRRY